MRPIRLALIAALAIAVVPASAQAASTTSVVSGLVGSELSLSVATPSTMSLTHAATATTTSVISVVSTQLSWTLKIKDAGATTPGFLDKVSGSGPAGLTNALQWRNQSGGTLAALSGTDATVATGSLIGAATVEFSQSLADTDTVATGDSYNLTATYTVT